MAVKYSTIKSLKFAKIGTIMSWAGIGSIGSLASNIPKGWLVCDGSSLPASRYPLLASIISDSYGGTNFTGDFPEYSGLFKIPNITGKCLMDLETSMLNDTKYLYKQYDAKNILGDLVKDEGFTTPINTLLLSKSDIIFSLAPIDSGIINAIYNIGAVSQSRKPGTYRNIASYGGSGEGALFTIIVAAGGAISVTIESGGQGYKHNDVLSFYDVLLGNGGAPPLTIQVNNEMAVFSARTLFGGKMTNLAISKPDFNTSIYTIPRKLGINHMPSHKHPGLYKYAEATSTGPMPFEPPQITVGGTVSGDCGGEQGFVNCQLSNPNRAATWQEGYVLATYYGDEANENTLPTTDKFLFFNTTTQYDYAHVPSLNAGPRVVDGSANTTVFSDTPNKLHTQDAWVNMFPKPGIHANKRNYFGLYGSPTGVIPYNPEDAQNVSTGLFAVGLVPMAAGVTKLLLPPGQDLGDKKDRIVPFMWVKGSGTGITPGTQIISVILKSGTQTSNYVYEIELSSPTSSNALGTETLYFSHGTFPTTINNTNAAMDPQNNAFTSHGHGTFDISMSSGTMAAPPTFPINNVSINNVYPESLKDALNIIVDVSSPSVNITYIIKAF